MLRDLFLGFVKTHILHHAAQEPVYGLALIAELRRHGYELSAGTLYPILHKMEQAGYLTRDDQLVEGKIRKYYRITDEGRLVLHEARVRLAELVEEVLEEPAAEYAHGKDGHGGMPEADQAQRERGGR